MKATFKSVRGRAKPPSKKSPAFSVRITHPDRVVYAEQGITKGQVANYYAAVAEWMLPHISGRPLALVRCPAGADGDCFFQKRPPVGLPDVVKRTRIKEKSGTSDYAVVNDINGLVALIQFGTLEIHTWGSRADDVERPDRLIFDLDPGPDVPWRDVIEAAELMRLLFNKLKLKSFVKTTGGKGLHIVVPVTPRQEWPAAKRFARRVAEFMAAAVPGKYITTMSKAARPGKIFIDYFRNDRGATAVAAYSTRARPGAPVSTPVSWQELRKTNGPQGFTVENVPARLAKLRRDPWAEMTRTRQAITAEMEKRLQIGV
jgi:bifunctional non-homologous end joining protein LigD